MKTLKIKNLEQLRIFLDELKQEDKIKDTKVNSLYKEHYVDAEDYLHRNKIQIRFTNNNVNFEIRYLEKQDYDIERTYYCKNLDTNFDFYIIEKSYRYEGSSYFITKDNTTKKIKEKQAIKIIVNFLLTGFVESNEIFELEEPPKEYNLEIE